MEIVPSVSMSKELPVIAIEGEYRVLRGKDGRGLDPIDLIERASKGYEKVMVLDIDGISTGEPQIEVLQEIPSYVKYWVDGGVRTCDDAYDLFMAGARKVVIGSKSLEDLSYLEELCDVSAEAVLGLDFSNGEFVIKDGSITLETLLDKAKELGLKEAVVEVLAGEVDPGTLGRIKASVPEVYITGKMADEERYSEFAKGLIVSVREVLEDLEWRN